MSKPGVPFFDALLDIPDPPCDLCVNFHLCKSLLLACSRYMAYVDPTWKTKIDDEEPTRSQYAYIYDPKPGRRGRPQKIEA